MPVLLPTTNLQYGSLNAGALYDGDTKVWPPPPFVPPSRYEEQIISSTPLSYWRLGEPIGSSTAVDKMGYHDAAYTGAPVLGVAGLIEGDLDAAMQVFGLGSQGMNAGNTDFQLYHDFTVECWFKTTTPGTSFRSLVVKQNDYGIFIIDNKLAVYEWGSALIVDSGIRVDDSVRHHAVVVFGINYGPAESQLYLDGLPVGPLFSHTLLDQNHTLAVGYNDYASQELTGVIDEVAIYNRRLTAIEVAMNHDVGVASPTNWREL